MRRYYAANAQKQRDRVNRRKRELRADARSYVQHLKEASPCTDCGVRYPYYVMQYDHTGSDKVANVADLVGTGNRSAIDQEIVKCDLVCANCHAERTHDRLFN